MNSSVLNHAEPNQLEEQRIAAIKALSYEERLERLMAILEISRLTRNAGTKITANNERTNNQPLEMPVR